MGLDFQLMDFSLYPEFGFSFSLLTIVIEGRKKRARSNSLFYISYDVETRKWDLSILFIDILPIYRYFERILKDAIYKKSK